MKLKPTGQLFLHRARAILSEVMQAKSELAQFDHSQMVRFREILAEYTEVPERKKFV